MQNGLIRLFSATLLASTALTIACADYTGTNKSNASAGGGTSAGGASGTAQGGTSSSTSAATGGAPVTTGGTSSAAGGSSAATGGSSNATGGVANCPSDTLCGSGDVVGTWQVKSSCLTVSGELDFSNVSIGCPSAPITGGNLEVTGTWTADSSGMFTDNTNTTGTVYFTLAPACLSISGSPPSPCSGIGQSLAAAGFTRNTICTGETSTGCECKGDVNNKQGSIGLPAGSPATEDMYSTDGNLLKLLNGHDETPYSYCVSDSTLTLSPQPAHPTITGTIVLEKQ